MYTPNLNAHNRVSQKLKEINYNSPMRWTPWHDLKSFLHQEIIVQYSHCCLLRSPGLRFNKAAILRTSNARGLVRRWRHRPLSCLLWTRAGVQVRGGEALPALTQPWNLAHWSCQARRPPSSVTQGQIVESWGSRNGQVYKNERGAPGILLPTNSETNYKILVCDWIG